MQAPLTALFPPNPTPQPLESLFLAHHLERQGSAAAPFIYASYIMSLNGVIATTDDQDRQQHPPELVDRRDLHVLCTLMAQADCLITNGSYLRDLQRGNLGNLLQLPSASEFQHLNAYRSEHLGGPLPSVLVVSRSLDFAIPQAIAEHGQTLHVLTTADAPQERITALRDQGVEVRVSTDDGQVESPAILHALQELGARSAYLFCGPMLNATLMRAHQVQRLYLTWAHLLLGGAGNPNLALYLPFGECRALEMRELYQSPSSPEGPAIWFGCFDVAQE